MSTAPKKKFRLTELVLSEVSLVDRPANPLATVVLFKRHSEDTTMTEIEKLAAEKAALETQVTKQAADIAALTENLTKLNARQATIEAENESLKKATKPEDKKVELPKEAQDQINKALADAAESKAALEKMRDDQDTAVYVAKASGFKAIPQQPEEFGLVLKRISQNKSTPADIISLETVLKASDALIAKGLDSRGSDQGGSSTAADKLDSLAKEIAKADRTTYPVAYAKALELNPGLYKEYLAERN